MKRLIKEHIRKKPNILYESFNTLSGWQTVTSGTPILSGDAGAIASGSVKLAGTSVTINNMGTRTGNGWVGPVIKKSLTRTTQDFKAFIKIRINKEKKGIGKGYLYLYNERGEIFCAIGLIDAHNSKNEVRCHVVLFNEYGEWWEWADTYGPKGRKYNIFDEDYIHIEVKRVGKVWNMRTWKYVKDKKGKKVLTGRMNKTYTDASNKYQQTIAQAGIGMFGHNKYNLEQPYIDMITIDEILPDQNSVPILINKNDEIYIDMEKALVTLNDAPALDEKDFGSDYFDLEQGVTELFIVPEETFETEVIWQDRFL